MLAFHPSHHLLNARLSPEIALLDDLFLGPRLLAVVKAPYTVVFVRTPQQALLSAYSGQQHLTGACISTGQLSRFGDAYNKRAHRAIARACDGLLFA